MTGSFITFWLICGVIAAVVASAKNRNALGWLALGVLFPPSVLIVAVLPKLQLVPSASLRCAQHAEPGPPALTPEKGGLLSRRDDTNGPPSVYLRLGISHRTAGNRPRQAVNLEKGESMRKLVGLASLAVLIAMAPPANADPNDDTRGTDGVFLASLEAQGVSSQNPPAAITAGKQSCTYMDQGHPSRRSSRL
jgi:hypothetical protein